MKIQASVSHPLCSRLWTFKNGAGRKEMLHYCPICGGQKTAARVLETVSRAPGEEHRLHTRV